ncbi:hypothetical protein N7519_008486 [Penicillium mononematosum]|uniref:uncharacterized protein n=1 Tax=Penicillium mononematosum TaxID=268346 RepID=UPI002549294B|nr:uncharacterized protein N7519_008486 [Penicillium mononematosum]KAJ6178025.1 hypothetical protein N7519_008486 [Penicillium mononematosum]
MNPNPTRKMKEPALDALATASAKVVPAQEEGIGTDLPSEPPPRATGRCVHGAIRGLHCPHHRSQSYSYSVLGVLNGYGEVQH